jgi:asparagine synthase (glutamine-hydrolysing)
LSVFSGIYHLDGRAVDIGLLDRMMAVGRPFGPDADGYWTDGPVGMSHCGLWTVAESLGETQPLSDDAGACWIVCDARVDNRDELVRELKGSRYLAETPTDAKLILAAYRAWDIGCASKIIGDFALAIWDQKRRRLFCAIDALGIRSFFYHFDGKRFLFGSLIRQLLQDPSVPRGLDEDYLAQFIARGECPTELTPYRSIKRLLAGSFILIENGRLRRQKYWDLDPKHEIRYSKDEEYEDHFKTVFREAVRAHLRTSGPLWSELSGGLDSSSIVCMAQEIYKAGEADNRGFTAFTMTFDESKKVDERNWSKLVVDKYGLNIEYFSADQYWLLKDVDERTAYWDEPTPKGLITASLRASAARVVQRGVRVLLTGIGGDQVFMGGTLNPIHFADLLRRFRWKQLSRELARWQPFLNLPFARVFLNNCVKPLLNPNTMIDPFYAKYWRPATWIAPAFSKRTHLADLMSDGFLPRRYMSPANQRQYLMIMRTPAALIRGRLMSPVIELRCPFLYRPLLEFAMGIPMDQKVRPGADTRSIVRRGMSGVLPDQIRDRKNKTVFDQHTYVGINREWSRIESLLNSPRVAELGVVDQQKFRQALELMRVGHSENIYQLISVLSLELWLRASEQFEGQREDRLPRAVSVA